MSELKRMWGIFREAAKEAHRDFWAPATAFGRELLNMTGPGNYSLQVRLSREANAALEGAVRRTGKTRRDVIEDLLVRATNTEPDSYNPKLASMILLLARGRMLGRSSLNWLLFLADMSCFLNHGRTISGARYRHMLGGPSPEGVEVTRRTLAKVNALREEQVDAIDSYTYIYHVQDNVVNYEAVRAALSAEELQSIQTVLKRIEGYSNQELRDKVLDSAPWKGAHSLEELDFQLALNDQPLVEWLMMTPKTQQEGG